MNGERYPLGSIGNIYNFFNHIILQNLGKIMKQENRQEPLINTSNHHFFLQTNTTIEKAMKLSKSARTNKPSIYEIQESYIC
jgi:hypothetical protein